MVKIALLGFGTVGSGVAELMSSSRGRIAARSGENIEIKYILDLRDFPGSPFESLVVHDFGVIERDPEISVVVEMMGGVRPAGDFLMKALKSGKHAVTSNKAVIAEMGPELQRTAEENGVRLLYEASTGGCIPVIRPLLAQTEINEITEISGILNGTTNYILTSMSETGAGFDDALAEAQRLGFAEADPSADVDGFDTCRKICILAATAFGKLVPFVRVKTTGIRGITPGMIREAKDRNETIKLIGRAVTTGKGIDIFCGPVFVRNSCLLAGINGAMNAIQIEGRASGTLLLAGNGAGKMPTADAVISDIIDIAKNPRARNDVWEWASPAEISDGSPLPEQLGRPVFS